MRGARARELGRIFLRLHERDRIGADVGFAARSLDRLGQIGWYGGGVEGHAFAAPAQILDELDESIGLEHVRMAAETQAARRRQLSSVEKHGRTALERQIGPADRQRRVGDVRAADIEQPRQIMRIADQETVRRSQGLPHARDLLGRAFAREAQLVRGYRAQRRGRPIRPDRVNRVRVDRDQTGARFLASGRISRDGVGRVKPGVITKLVALFELPRDPLARRLLRDMAEFEHRRVGLALHLLRVSAVDEQRGRLLQHQCEPGGAGKSGQPSQPLGVGGHIFVLVLVRAGHDESSKPQLRQFGAQLAHASAPVRWIAQCNEGLKTTLKHAAPFPELPFRPRSRPAP